MGNENKAPNKALLLSHQIKLEKLYNKNQVNSRVRKEFEECKSFNFAKYFTDNNIPVEFGFSLLVQIALHKRTDLPTMVGIMRHHLDDAPSPAQATADMILKCCEADLLNWSPINQQLIVIFTISDDVQEELDRYQFPLPMVVEPMPVKSNTDIGYVTFRGSLILKNNHHEEDICLDHINRMNQIKFVINNDTATMVKNRWRNLDKPKQGETKADYQRRVRAFDKYDKSSHHVIREVNKHGKEFYLTHRYDKRGRIYCQGYHISYQGTPWNKAVVELANKELVNG